MHSTLNFAMTVHDDYMGQLKGSWSVSLDTERKEGTWSSRHT